MNPHDPDTVEPTPSPTPLSPSLLARLERHFLACSAFAGTGMGLLALTDSAHADPFVKVTAGSPVQPGITVWASPTGGYQINTSTNVGVYFNIKTGIAYNHASAQVGPLLNVYFNSTNNFFTIYSPQGRMAPGQQSGIYVFFPSSSQKGKYGTAQAALFNAGQTIGPNQFIQNYYGKFGNGITFTPGSPLFLGFTYNPSGTKFQGQYGFVELIEKNNNYYIVGWAYTLSNFFASIQAFNIPEPGTLGLSALAMGAAGIVAMRKKRAAAKKAAEEAAAPPPPPA